MYVAKSLLMMLGLAQATEFSTNSAAGRSILRKAKAVKPSKFLSRGLQEDGEMDYEQLYQGLSSMTIKYVGCSTYAAWSGQQGAQQDGQQQQQQQDGQQQQQQGDNQQAAEGQYYDGEYGYYQQEAQNDGLEPNNLVRFTLCTGSGCGGTCDGEYVLDMEYFMEMYTEWKMEHDSFWCERVRENCMCNPYQNGGNWDNGQYSYTWESCYTSCFEQSNYGLTYQGCIDANQQDNANVFQIQQYLQCNGIKFYNPDYQYQQAYQNINYNYAGYDNANANGGNANANGGDGSFSWRDYFYLSPTCENNQDVVLQAFYDQDCSYAASDSEVEQAMGSYSSIPYLQGTPLLSRNTCLSCMSDDDLEEMEENNGQQRDYNANAQNNYNVNYNHNQNWEDQPDANDLCQAVLGFEEEANVIVCDPNRYRSNGCTFINEMLPSLDGRFSFDYQAQLAKLRDQLDSSERLQWALLGVVLFLVGVIAAWAGYVFSSRSTPRHRSALLEYRRENQLA